MSHPKSRVARSVPDPARPRELMGSAERSARSKREGEEGGGGGWKGDWWNKIVKKVEGSQAGRGDRGARARGWRRETGAGRG